MLEEDRNRKLIRQLGSWRKSGRVAAFDELQSATGDELYPLLEAANNRSALHLRFGMGVGVLFFSLAVFLTRMTYGMPSLQVLLTEPVLTRLLYLQLFAFNGTLAATVPLLALLFVPVIRRDRSLRRLFAGSTDKLSLNYCAFPAINSPGHPRAVSAWLKADKGRIAQLLSELQPEDAERVEGPTWQALIHWLHGYAKRDAAGAQAPAIAIALLNSLITMERTEALNVVRKIASSPRQSPDFDRVKQAAKQILPGLELLAANQDAGNRLLRASAHPAAAGEVLLRSAFRQEAHDAERLLRANASEPPLPVTSGAPRLQPAQAGVQANSLE